MPDLSPKVKAEIEQIVSEHPDRFPELAAMLPEPEPDHTVQPVGWKRNDHSNIAANDAEVSLGPSDRVGVRFRGTSYIHLAPTEALDMADALIRNACHALGVDGRRGHGGTRDAYARVVLYRLGDLLGELKTK